MAEMVALREAALDGTDPDGVHDMRVASRRLRSASRDFMTYLGKESLAKWLEEVKTIGQSLGKVRDYDVSIETLKMTAASAPSEIANGIRWLTEFDSRQREVERQNLMRVLEPSAMRRLSATFVDALDGIERAVGKTTLAEGPPAGNVTYREVARSVLLGHLAEIEERSKGFYQPNKIKRLHKIRLAAKPLRYALELFDQCWAGQAAFFARKLSKLQSSLGEVHDCDVWIKRLGDAIVHGRQSVNFDYKTASAWLISHFVGLRAKHFRKALRQWREWESSQCDVRLRTILVSGATGYGESIQGAGQEVAISLGQD